jgi:hypothetical protein
VKRDSQKQLSLMFGFAFVLSHITHPASTPLSLTLRGEFGLYYNIGPKRTMSTAGVGRSQGGKRDRQRMSLLYLVCMAMRVTRVCG